jgi:hypothetical protein
MRGRFKGGGSGARMGEGEGGRVPRDSRGGGGGRGTWRGGQNDFGWRDEMEDLRAQATDWWKVLFTHYTNNFTSMTQLVKRAPPLNK